MEILEAAGCQAVMTKAFQIMQSQVGVHWRHCHRGGGGSFKTFGVSETWLIGRHCPHGYTTPPPHHSSTSKLAPIAKVEKTNLEGGAYLKYIFMTWDSYNSQPFVSFYTLSHNLSHKV